MLKYFFLREADTDAKVVRLKPIEPDAAKAQEYLERARVDRQQQAKSWETSRRNEHGATLAASLQTACSRDGRFTEGFFRYARLWRYSEEVRRTLQG